ncbi:MAG: hypothetical protein JSU08_06315 [Acidobacteria bacterium]|nr:hypothetical protein [Acidobacteriota bacterium]
MTRVCLVTTGQPSTNPRLVKEADALVEAGYDVRAIGAFWAPWALETDPGLMATRRWTFGMIDWRKERSSVIFHGSRVRHWLARRAVGSPFEKVLTAAAVLARVGPELARAAAAAEAELYVAHNLGALPAAIHAARAHDARTGFDAEDFHSGQLPVGSPLARYTARVERSLLPMCDYVTAASPGIAEAYEAECGIGLPPTVLNVFPLASRPAHFREPDPQAPVRLYWFSQSIGPDRGLETAVHAVGLCQRHGVELHVQGAPLLGYDRVLRELAIRVGLPQSALHIHPPDAPDAMVQRAAGYDIGLAIEPLAGKNNDLALSNKVFTYLLAGCAVAATRTHGQARLLPQLGDAAVGCAPNDAASLAAALEPWLADRARLLGARRMAWALGESTFNWDREKLVLLGVVKKALEHPNVRRSA